KRSASRTNRGEVYPSAGPVPGIHLLVHEAAPPESRRTGHADVLRADAAVGPLDGRQTASTGPDYTAARTSPNRSGGDPEGGNPRVERCRRTAVVIRQWRKMGVAHDDLLCPDHRHR